MLVLLATFTFDCSLFSIDATFEERLGRYVNDSLKYANCMMKPLYIKEDLHLCLFAIKDIGEAEELRYNYNAPGMNFRKVCQSNECKKILFM